MNTQEILNLIEKNRMQYGYFGIRAMTRNPKTNEMPVAVVGGCVECSFVWDDRDYTDSTDEMLNGTSAIKIDVDADADVVGKAIKHLSEYTLDGEQVAFLASQTMEFGEDRNEIVMQSAIVLATW